MHCAILINDPAMTEERSTKARAAADKALALIENANAGEKALIRAVDKRYALPIAEDRRPLDEAYAEAMGVAYKQFKKDSDIGALYAESLMNLQPWDYWDNESNPKGRILEVLNILEGVLKRTPNHPGANHFYIPAADRLRNLVPGSGHLVHMPSHIYIRVGQYSDAVDANADAVVSDRAYFQRAPEPAMYAVY